MHSKFFSRTLITIRTVVELSATRENWEFGKKVDDQICFFVEHGLMHLLGYHHAE